MEGVGCVFCRAGIVVLVGVAGVIFCRWMLEVRVGEEEEISLCILFALAWRWSV